MAFESWHFVLLHGVVGSLDDSMLPIAALGVALVVLFFAAYGLLDRGEAEESDTESGHV